MNSSKDHNTPKPGTEPDDDQLYRLVPAEESSAYEYSTINFAEFLYYYWEKRRVFYWCIAIFLVIGLFIAFFSPVEYQAEASIIPEYELQDRVNEIIESYSLLFGLTGSIRESRTPSYLLELYPYMISSISFQQSLMQRPFRYDRRDTTITMYHYFTAIHQPPLTQTVYKYTLGLPGIIANTLQSGEETGTAADSLSPAPDSRFEILNLSPQESNVINELDSRLAAGYQRRTGIVRIRTTMPEPGLAAILAKLTLEVLHDKARAYKTGKGRVYLQFLRTQLEQAQAELEQAREALRQLNNEGEQLSGERLELQSNYDAALGRYSIVQQQLNRIQTDIQEQLPVFRVLDDITVPKQKSEPDRKLIITVSLLAGIFAAIGWITIMFFVSRLKRPSS